jgi:hypothetical protein
MQRADLTDTEHAVAAHCATGSEIDVTGWPDRTVRAEALRFMLLGGVTAEPGDRAELRLTGALVQGAFEVEFAELRSTARSRCATAPAPDWSASVARRSAARCSCAAPTCPARASPSTARPCGYAVTCSPTTGFTCRGAFRVDRAEIEGILTLEGAVLGGSGDAAASILHAPGIARGGLDDSEWSAGVAFSGRHLTARELILLLAQPPGGLFDLRHAKLGLLRDTPATWPPGLRIDGLSYEALADVDERDARLRWLRLDPAGFRPQPYAHLAQVYRAAGRDEDARTVLLAGERHCRDTLSRPGRWWGRLQDMTVGYGYRPVRAGLWLAGLFTVGTVVFQWHKPRAADPGKAPDFVAPIYTLDLILPVGDFGQQSAYHPRGATAWLAYTLIVAGLILATTVAAAGARRLRRT